MSCGDLPTSHSIFFLKQIHVNYTWLRRTFTPFWPQKLGQHHRSRWRSRTSRCPPTPCVNRQGACSDCASTSQWLPAKQGAQHPCWMQCRPCLSMFNAPSTSRDHHRLQQAFWQTQHLVNVPGCLLPVRAADRLPPLRQAAVPAVKADRGGQPLPSRVRGDGLVDAPQQAVLEVGVAPPVPVHYREAHVLRSLERLEDAVDELRGGALVRTHAQSLVRPCFGQPRHPQRHLRAQGPDGVLVNGAAYKSMVA